MGRQVAMVQACLEGAKPLFFPGFDSDLIGDRMGSGSVMRSVSKAKFEGSLLGSALPERAGSVTSVWLSMGTLRANLVRRFRSTRTILQITRHDIEIECYCSGGTAPLLEILSQLLTKRC